MDKTNTPDEIIDLVNEKDEIIGQTTKGEANQNPKLIHREVFVLIVDKANKVLLSQRCKLKLVEPLMWSISAAGHVPQGLSIQEAAHKELEEELGFDTNLFFIEKELIHRPNETRFVSWFIGMYDGEPLQPDENEIDQIKFVDERLLNEMIAQGDFIGEATISIARRFWNNEFKDILT